MYLSLLILLPLLGIFFIYSNDYYYNKKNSLYEVSKKIFFICQNKRIFPAEYTNLLCFSISKFCIETSADNIKDFHNRFGGIQPNVIIE